MDEEKIVEEVKAVEQPTIDVEALKKSIIEDLKAERGEEKGSPTVKAPAVIGSLGEVDYTKAYWHYLKTETSDRKATPSKPIEEGDAQGSLFPDDEYGKIIARRDEESLISRLGLLRQYQRQSISR